MASIVREVVIASPAPRCWEALRAFDALHTRLAPGFVTDVTMVGERDRKVTFFTGNVATERLVGIDEQSMRLAYTLVDGPLNAAHYNASAQVIPDGEDRCRFVWAIDVLPDELADRVAGLMEAGLRAIRATLDSAGDLHRTEPCLLSPPNWARLGACHRLRFPSTAPMTQGWRTTPG